MCLAYRNTVQSLNYFGESYLLLYTGIDTFVAAICVFDIMIIIESEKKTLKLKNKK